MKRDGTKQVAKDNKDQIEDENKPVFDTLMKVTECIAKAFGTNCEVVLHSLRDPGHSIIKIENGHITGRKVGHPLTDYSIEVLREARFSGEDVVGSHLNKLDDGTPLKSTDLVIRNKRGDPIGMLCINIDLSVSAFDFMKDMLGRNKGAMDERVEHFPTHPSELVSRALEQVTKHLDSREDIPDSDRNKMLVNELYKSGIFDIKGAVDIIARKIGISRYTVYNHIREARVTSEEDNV